MSKIVSSIDLSKFVASLLIVVLHCHPFEAFQQTDYYITTLCRIALPFFFIASSYFYFKGNKSIWVFIKRLLILYTCWFLIELPLTIYRFFINTDNSLLYDSFLFTRGLLINSTFFASWFITALWQGVLIVWWLSRRLSDKVLFAIGLLCFLLACSWSMYREVFIQTPLWPVLRYIGIFLAPSNSFIVAIPFCIIGKYFADHPDIRVKYPGIFIPILLLIVVLEIWLCRPIGYMSDTYLSLILICPCIFLSILHWNLWLSQEVSKTIRNCSILIYLLHLPIRYLIGKFSSIPESGAIMFAIVLPCSIFLALIIVQASKRYHVLRYLF